MWNIIAHNISRSLRKNVLSLSVSSKSKDGLRASRVVAVLRNCQKSASSNTVNQGDNDNLSLSPNRSCTTQVSKRLKNKQGPGKWIVFYYVSHKINFE